MPPVVAPDLAMPGVIPLRPLRIGEIFSGAFRTIGAYPRLLLGVATVVMTLGALVNVVAAYLLLDDVYQIVVEGPNLTTEEQVDAFRDLLGSAAISIGISSIVWLLALLALTGFVMVVVGKAVLGQPVTFGETWATVRSRLLPLLGLAMIYPLAGIALFVPAIVLMLVIPALGFLVLLATYVVALWLIFLFVLATPVLMLENTTIRRAFSRSRQLVRGSWWRVFGILLLTGLIGLGITLVVGGLFTAAGGGFDLSPAPGFPTRYVVLTTLGNIVAGVLTETFGAAVIALLYTDQRMRREGLDVELAGMAGRTRR